jgi:hypothetical protein
MLRCLFPNIFIQISAKFESAQTEARGCKLEAVAAAGKTRGHKPVVGRFRPVGPAEQQALTKQYNIIQNKLDVKGAGWRLFGVEKIKPKKFTGGIKTAI